MAGIADERASQCKRPAGLFLHLRGGISLGRWTTYTRVPFFSGAKNLVSPPLTGGITNLNYRIDADGKSYVLRITGADTAKLGIQRDVDLPPVTYTRQ